MFWPGSRVFLRRARAAPPTAASACDKCDCCIGDSAADKPRGSLHTLGIGRCACCIITCAATDHVSWWRGRRCGSAASGSVCVWRPRARRCAVFQSWLCLQALVQCERRCSDRFWFSFCCRYQVVAVSTSTHCSSCAISAWPSLLIAMSCRCSRLLPILPHIASPCHGETSL